MKIYKYHIVKESHMESLIDKINYLIKFGHRPLGGVQVIYDPDLRYPTFYQAMGEIET